jgi:hypothetical protein
LTSIVRGSAASGRSVVAEFIRQRDYYVRGEWPMSTFGDEQALPTDTENAPKIPRRRHSRLEGQPAPGPDGGASTQPALALSRDRMAGDEDGISRRAAHAGQGGAGLAADGWWWD